MNYLIQIEDYNHPVMHFKILLCQNSCFDINNGTYPLFSNSKKCIVERDYDICMHMPEQEREGE